MMPKLTVACVLRTGAYHGRYYTPIWVMRLQRMVAKHLTLPHRFVCLSNMSFVADGVEVHDLHHHDWLGWWSKIELFGPAFDNAKRVLYFDLDVLITGSIDELALNDEPLIFTPPHPALTGEPKRDTSRVKYVYQTSCMAWSPPEGRRIFDDFSAKESKRLASDQDWIAEVEPDRPTFPVEWFKKLRQCYDGPPPGVKVILMMPEKNNAAAKLYPWVKEVWMPDDDERELLGAEGGMAYS